MPVNGTPEHCRDQGSISVLVLGYTAIAALLVIVGVDASAAFLARRALTAAADDAAVAAAGSLDTSAVYAGGLRCGQPLPVDPGQAVRAAGASIASDTDLRHTFTDIAAPTTTVAGTTATVDLSARARLPLSGVIGLIDPAARNGVLIHVRSSARSPTVAPGGC
jgi:uncharacterized membrane protein